MSSGRLAQSDAEQRIQAMGRGNQQDREEEQSKAVDKREERRKKATGGKGGGGTQVQFMWYMIFVSSLKRCLIESEEFLPYNTSSG